jgi:hypothetical protein
LHALAGNAWNGVQHHLVYVDSSKRGDESSARPALEVALEKALADYISAGKVKLVYFHLRGEGW